MPNIAIVNLTISSRSLANAFGNAFLSEVRQSGEARVLERAPSKQCIRAVLPDDQVKKPMPTRRHSK